MSETNFDLPSRQSVKGIVVLFSVSVYKVLRGTIIIIAAFFVKYIQSDKAVNFYNPKLIISVIAFLLFFLGLAILKYLNFKFYLNKEHFILNQGIINKEEISISKSKIQNVYIKQNLIQQIINVVSLSIETAGDNNTEIEIKALSKSKAEALKVLLLAYNKPDIEEKIDAKTDSTVYYKASLKKLLLEGISENHFKSLIIVLAFILGWYTNFKDFIKQFEISTQFNAYFQLDEKALLGLVLFNITIIIILIIIAFIVSLLKTLVQNFNLIVYKTKDGLEISKGLFNKISLGLVSSRIQNTTISSNRFKRALGLYKLAFTQAMVNKKQQLKFNIIGLSKPQIEALINEFYPKFFSGFKKYKPSRYFILKDVFYNIVFVLFFNSILFFAPNELLFINIPLIILLACNIIYAYKKAYYSIDTNYVIVGSGKFVDTNESFLEIHKVQAVTLTQTIFQKRRSLASVKIHSASKTLTIPHIKLQIARNITNYLLYKVVSSNTNWM